MPICCVDISRFAVEAERQRKDIASGLIFIGKAIVFDCSPGAEASGVKRGMRMQEALGLCDRATVLPPDILYYERQFEEVLDFLEGFSPEVEVGDLGAAYLSLKGLPVEPESFAEELIALLHRRSGYMASMGIANSKFTSQVVARTTRPGMVKMIPSSSERDFLAPLAVGHLPTNEAMRWRLQLLGLETMGDIARLPLEAFQSQFGLEGKRCWELARGIDTEPLVPRITEEIITRRLQMPAPAVTLETILTGVERLVYAAYCGHERRGRWVRKAKVKASLDGGGAWELSVPFREAMANPRDAWFVIKGATARHPPERPVEDLGVELIGLSGESGKQATMFEGKGKLWQQIEETVRQLRAQQGQALIGTVVEVEPWSRIPERRMALADFDL